LIIKKDFKMKNYRILILLLIMTGFSACENQILDLKSPTEPVDATFYSNEQELELALTGVYNTLRFQGGYQLPIQVGMDNAATDLGINRGADVAGMSDLGQGSHGTTTGGFQTAYSHFYTGISRANLLLGYMDRAKDKVAESKFKAIQAQAMVLRAYNYMYLTELFGDVPYIDVPIKDPAAALLPRVPKAEIVDKIMADLQTASGFLPDTWPANDYGKITKGVALGLRARIALYNKKYNEAATSAKAVMDNEASMKYSLHPDYGELFTAAGRTSSEIMLVLPFKEGFSTTQFPVAQGSRNLGGYSTVVPTQSLIDSYEATDGKPIDESAVYNPKKPFENRDPRLKKSIIIPQTSWGGIIFESHPDSLRVRLANGTISGNNADSRKVIWPAAFFGYLWKKYTDEQAQIAKRIWSDMNFTLMRYSEILLIYAEAKIELNQVDASVLTAINRVRARAYGVNVSQTDNYPAITSTNQAELRKVIRRERKVELANEGFRLFDIRRWRIAEKVMPVKLYGRVLNLETATGIPDIDDDCFVSYAGIESQYDFNPDARFPNAQNRKFNPARDYLCPIPQQEIDTYNGLGATLTQNPGY
jgi:starch-binding outer membrane protein, SusD/RagB family